MAIELTKLLQVVVEKNASDLHLTVGIPPVIRVHGELKQMKLPPLTPEDTNSYMKAITSEKHQQELKEVGSTDFGFAYEDKARFRTAVFMQKGNVGLVLRQIPNKLLTLEEIGLPPHVKNLLFRPRGLILITGPTGSGKTTTLASMIDFINTEAGVHIITIEDPIEYYFNHKKSIVNQREVGADITSFAEAIRRALRMDPDVILVGEMRDLDTIQAAITAAETGHLVFGTLHTTGAAKTINRIIDAFPTNQQAQIRAQLSVNLVAVISQVLMARSDIPGRIAGFEVMVMTPAISHLIRENEIHKISSAIQTGTKYGMVMLDDFLFNVYSEGKISYETMLEFSQDPETIERKVKESTAQYRPFAKVPLQEGKVRYR